jgi:ferredoxin-NADP reductase
MQADDGTLSNAATLPLKPSQREAGYFLSCQCQVVDTLTVRQEDRWGAVAVLDQRQLSDRVTRLDLECAPFDFRPGQFVNLQHPNGAVRSYSIASLPSDDHLELHVSLVDGGQMSPWLCSRVDVTDILRVQGPAGDCFYTVGSPEQTILMVCTGTGLAPLWGVLRDAVDRGHTGDIHLLHGGRTAANLYMVDVLRDYAHKHENVHYHPCVKDDPAFAATTEVETGTLESVLASLFSSTVGMRAFLCGNPDMVASVRKQIFLAGADYRDISADPFVLAPQSD